MKKLNLHLTDVPFSDLDNWIWIVASGAVVGLVAGLSMIYQGWEVPQSLNTVVAVCATYFAAAMAKRVARMKQRKKREGAS